MSGRRIFQEEEDSDGGGEISSDWLNMAQEREVMMMINDEKNICGGKRISLGGGEHGEFFSVVAFDQSSCSCSDNSSLPEKKVLVVVEEKRGGDGKPRGYMVAMAWFAFVLILVTRVLISMSCNGKFVEENELILVPT